MTKVAFKTKSGKKVSFNATGKKARAKTKTVYITKKPHTGATRKISAKGLAKMRANGRKQVKNLAKYAKAVAAGKVTRRKGRIVKIKLK